MGNPDVAQIDIVLNQDQPPPWSKIVVNELQNAIFPALEMQRIGHQYPIKWGEIEGTGVVGHYCLQLYVRKACLYFRFLAA